MATVSKLNVNGATAAINVDAECPLLSVLRDELDLTGAKYGCGEGRCGACTVLLDGAAVRSCVTKVGSVGDQPITTIEALAREGKLHPVQQAFLDAGAMQCGYCTCGMIMSAVALLARKPRPEPDEIVRAMDGNICRCGSYPRIVSAIQQAAASMKEVAP